MRYLVTAKVKAGRRAALKRAIDDGSLGRGSIAGGEYLHNMATARELADGRVKWVEMCFCAIPLDEERPYWEDVLRARDRQGRTRAQHMPRPERHRAVGLLELRLHGEARAVARTKKGQPFTP